MFLVVVLLSLPFLYLIARKPVLRRLALRNAVRRPRESVLVVLGALLGTAIMTGSFVVGDTFNASIKRNAYEQLGPVDEIVATNGIAGAAQLQSLFRNYSDPNVDGLLPVTRASASAATTGANPIAAPKSQLLETDFSAARAFGGDAHATGMAGATPVVGEAAIGRDLANTLKVKPGATIDVFAWGAKAPLRVTSILPKRGVAGFWSGDETASNNVFVAPGTIAAMRARGPAKDAAPPQSLLLVSNKGGVESGSALTATVDRSLVSRIGDAPVSVNNRKQAVLERAQQAGQSLSRLYSSLGAFAVLAGILLLVNIFFMLADERKSELGMLRAVGLKRGSLIGAFATEGWCYAVVSSIAGTFAGLLLGRALMAAAARLFATRTTDTRLTLHFAFQWSSVQRGLVIGFVIAITTVVITSIWLSRFNIIQAIRDITEPRRRRPRRRSSLLGLGAAVIGLLITGAGVATSSFFALMLGPVLVMIGVAPTLARNFSRKAVNTGIATAVLLWAVAVVPVSLALNASIDILLFVVQGLVLVAAAVTLVAQHQEAIGHAMGRLANNSLRVRLGLAYPLARRFRTSMTLGMFALVVFILVMVSVFAAMFSGQIGKFTRDASGGYNVVVESNPTNPVPPATLASEPSVRAAAPITTVPMQIVRAPGLRESRGYDMTGFDGRFVDHGAPALDDRASYPTDAAAYRAVLGNPNLAIIDRMFLARGAGPPSESVKIGDQFTVQDPASGRERTFTVAAFMTDDVADNGMFVGQPVMHQIFGARAVANRAYLDVENPQAFSAAFAGHFLANGGQAETIRHIVQTEMSQQQQFFLLMRGYLALGLVVGVAGIGVIMVRAVRERRRQVGVLRALGFQATAVRGAFVVESAFVAVEGVVIGTVLALVCSWSITLTDAFGSDIGFTVPFGAIALLMIGTLLFALLATAAPARAAAKIEPAVALRLAD
jgi:putative ABC transport system permease protein